MSDGTHTSCRTPECAHTHTQITSAPSAQQPTQNCDFSSAHLRPRCHDNHVLDTHHEYDLGGERHPNRTDPDERRRSQHHHHHRQQPVTAVEWLLYSVTEGVLQYDSTRCTLVRQCEAYSPTVGTLQCDSGFSHPAQCQRGLSATPASDSQFSGSDRPAALTVNVERTVAPPTCTHKRHTVTELLVAEERYCRKTGDDSYLHDASPHLLPLPHSCPGLRRRKWGGERS